jgi:hypothetical protein
MAPSSQVLEPPQFPGRFKVLGVASLSKQSLTLDEVEALFNRLISVSEGRPISQETLPTDARFFATMVILREFMHHLGFAAVSLQPTSTTT